MGQIAKPKTVVGTMAQTTWKRIAEESKKY